MGGTRTNYEREALTWVGPLIIIQIAPRISGLEVSERREIKQKSSYTTGSLNFNKL